MPLNTALSSYDAFAKQKGFKPISIDLPGGARGFWIGDRDLQDVILYFVGEAFQI